MLLHLNVNARPSCYFHRQTNRGVVLLKYLGDGYVTIRGMRSGEGPTRYAPSKMYKDQC